MSKGGMLLDLTHEHPFIDDAEYMRWVDKKNDPDAVFVVKPESLAMLYPNGYFVMYETGVTSAIRKQFPFGVPY